MKKQRNKTTPPTYKGVPETFTPQQSETLPQEEQQQSSQSAAEKRLNKQAQRFITKRT